jgi:hypothetical protein
MKIILLAVIFPVGAYLLALLLVNRRIKRLIPEKVERDEFKKTNEISKEVSAVMAPLGLGAALLVTLQKASSPDVLDKSTIG